MLQTPQEWAHGLVGQSQQIASIRRLIEKAAVNRLPVLLLGETGTGKEVVARAIHDAHPRGQFVPIDCGSLVGTLMESELFGHVKGSFSGAIGDKRGLVELADGGTAFFDEIGDLPLDMQVKLLRLIQEQEFRAVGSLQWRKVDLRIIAATHRDLKVEVAAGRFRMDLFYRLNVFSDRSRNSARWARCNGVRWTCGSSPRRTATSKSRWPRAVSAWTCFTASTSSQIGRAHV